MNTLLMSYFLMFMHPFKCHKHLRASRAYEEGHWQYGFKPGPMTWSESVSVSWIFICAQGLLSLIALNFGDLFADMVLKELNLSSLRMGFFSGKLSIISLIHGVILFPLISLIYSITLKLILKFFADLFDFAEDAEVASNQVVSSIFSANCLLILPIVGELARNVAGLVILFAGLRQNFGYTKIQSFVVMLAPVFIVALLLFLMLISLFIFYSFFESISGFSRFLF